MPDDGTIDQAYYAPVAAVTGANTNTRKIGITPYDWFIGSLDLGTIQLNSGVNLAANVASKVFSMNAIPGPVSAGVQAANTPYVAALQGLNGSTGMNPAHIFWTSTKVGTGLADPGGTVIVRYGTKHRNYAVGGASLLGLNQFMGSWWTCFSWSPWQRPNAPEVNVTAAYSSGTTLTVQGLTFPIPFAGYKIAFPQGTVTVNAAAAMGAGSLTIVAPGFTIPIGQQGHLISSSAGGYESLSPSGINVNVIGLNDADWATQDLPAWTETVRAQIARQCCPVVDYSTSGNFAYTTGGGTWANVTPPAAGALPYVTDIFTAATGTLKYWTGTASGDSTTIYIGPAFEGGTVDLFVLSVAGSNLGVEATITVDGGTPPQGAVTLDTGSVSTSGINQRTDTGTISASASTTVTGVSTSFGQSDVGTILTSTGGTGAIPPGTFITAVASTTSFTVSQAITVSGATPTTHGYTPMVKRLTGLSAGAHTVTLTITAADSAASTFILYGLGLESQSPLTPVIWANIARAPGQSGTQQSNATALNTASLAVINGTATPVAGNTAEPAFGSNVQYVDIDSLIGASAAYFLNDGIHPNSRGHRLLAVTFFSVIRANFSPSQLIAK